jgi:hypothetical protein
MKAILFSSLLVLSSVSYAQKNDCKEAYVVKANKRDARNVALTIGGITATAALWVTPIGYVAAAGTIGIFAHATNAPQNKFYRIHDALVAVEKGKLNSDDFQKLAGKVKYHAFKDYQLRLDDQAIADLLKEANKSQAICPLIRIKKDGSEKRGVLNPNDIAKYIAHVAATGNSELIVDEKEPSELNINASSRQLKKEIARDLSSNRLQGSSAQ